MDQQVVIEALVQSTRKRRILPKGPSTRLGDYAKKKGVDSLVSLRAWLASGEGLSSDLVRKITEFLPPPTLTAFGKYTPLAHLADGGMGSVWLSCDPDNKLVVVKTLKNNTPLVKEGSVGTEFMKRFEREAKITQQLKHPNVVHCLDNGIAADGSMFMVLEYVDSGDLRDVVEARSGLSEALTLAIMYQVVDGLAEAHRFKLVHRDIKPPNIFVAGDGTAKLADFGIARSTEEQRTMLTMQGAIVGSPLYMSPEQVLTDPTLDIRSDIYAMGAVLYFCLAAQAPYDGKLQEILHKHCTEAPPDIRKKRPSISDKTQNIINTCMAKDRKQRYADPTALRAAIAETLVGLGLKPGAKVDEETVDEVIGPGAGQHTPRPSGLGDDKTIAANLNQAVGTANPTKGSPAIDPEATMAVNLNSPEALSPSTGVRAKMPTLTEGGFDEIKTLTASLLSEEVASGLAQAYATAQGRADPGTQATLNLKGSAGGGANLDATMAVDFAADAAGPALHDRIDGDITAAIATDWVNLVSPTAGDPGAIMLFGRTKVVMGKLREPPVDICLRNYPIAVHKDACQRISRQHLTLTYDAIGNQCEIEDLNAPNGTMLDGIVVPPSTSCPLSAEGENILVLSNTVSLWLRCFPRRGPRIAIEGIPEPATAPACGADTLLGYDSVTMTRPENRPEMAYALVLRRLTIGGPGSELVCAGARTRAAIEIALYAGRWIWRVTGPGKPWKPLIEGTELDCGGKLLKATAGSYTHF
ncbi:MAG: protein kinase [Planctomycetes bacterium]|nr:protein kinase [Planctomycetota bacterium]